MKATDIQVSTGRDASASLGIVTCARYHSYPAGSTAEGIRYLQELNFSDEIAQLRAEALERGASAVTDISFAVNNLPGGVFILATGTAVKG